MNGPAEYGFFFAAMLTFIFGIFALTYLQLREAHRRVDGEDARVRRILDESLPLPDWREVLTLLGLIYGVLILGMMLYYALAGIGQTQLMVTFFGSKLLLMCCVLGLLWIGFVMRLSRQKRQRKHLSETLNELNPLHKAQLQPATALQSRVNLRSCVITETNHKADVFFQTTESTRGSVNGFYRQSTDGFVLFVSDEHQDFVLSLAQNKKS